MRAARWVVLGGLVVAVLAWAGWQWSHGTRGPAAPGPAAADSLESGFRSVRLWFVDRSGDSLVSEPREVIEQTDLHERAAVLVGELARGSAQGHLSLLPAGTAVRHVYLDEGGRLTLDLSAAFRSGFRGGAGAEELAVAQLVRTLGDGLPEVRQVLFVCEGTPLASLGGHLPLDRPLDPADWP